jgi:uncharacterized membrane protein YhaH (DUF805 family)
MSIRLSDLWHWQGTVDRVPYLVLGTVLMVIKFGLDWLVAGLVFGRAWHPFHYLMLPHEAARIDQVKFEDRVFYAALLLLALPFVWCGVALTLRRLRATGLPAALVVLFFVPVVNLVFFLVLGLLPSKPAQEERPRLPRLVGLRKVHYRVAGDKAAASGAVALIFTVPLGLGLTLLSVEVLGNYGWGLFVGLPFAVGMISVLLYGFQQPRDLGTSLLVAVLSIAFLGAALLALAFEGAVCLLMAAPIAVALGVMGGIVGWAIQLRPWNAGEVPCVVLALTLALPALMGAEYSAGLEPPPLEVTTTVEIDAPPETVWKHVVSFAELPEPDDWFFRTGAAYPMRAEIDGQGVGAVRHCVFSTGAFVEPIDVWDEPRRLGFTVAEQPPPLKEWSPWDTHPPHLDHYLVSQRGQFLLTPLPGGRTRLEGTTWYTNKMWPAAYWQLWSDMAIHRIHLRVLDHIKRLCEREQAASGA